MTVCILMIVIGFLTLFLLRKHYRVEEKRPMTLEEAMKIYKEAEHNCKNFICSRCPYRPVIEEPCLLNQASSPFLKSGLIYLLKETERINERLRTTKTTPRNS